MVASGRGRLVLMLGAGSFMFLLVVIVINSAFFSHQPMSYLAFGSRARVRGTPQPRKDRVPLNFANAETVGMPNFQVSATENPAEFPQGCIHVLMPSIPRPVLYVRSTVTSILGEAAHAKLCVNVTIANVRPSKLSLAQMVHEVNTEDKPCPPRSSEFCHEERVHEMLVHAPKVSDSMPNPKKQSKAVRQQILDFYNVLSHFQPRCPAGDIFMLMEDDFVWCSGMAPHLRLAFDHFRRRRGYTDFRGVRVAPGLNGLLLPCDGIAEMMDTVFWANKEDPIDYLLGKAWFDSGRFIDTYRFSLMHHIGHVSTVGNNKDKYENRQPPSCGELMSIHESLPPTEYFDVESCCLTMFSPCASKTQQIFWLADEDMLDASGELKKAPPMDALDLVRGEPGESCATACGRRNLKCDRRYADAINECSLVKKSFSDICPAKDDCVVSIGGDQPAVDPTRDPPICLQSSCILLFDCAASFPVTKRLCPCVKMGGGGGLKARFAQQMAVRKKKPI